MTSYLDASVVVAAIVTEAASDRVAQFIEKTPERILISEFVVAESSSAISRLFRIGEQTRDEADFLIGELDDWIEATAESTDVESTDFVRATGMVRDFNLKLRAPDALHLAIAERLEARLITLDSNLHAAAIAVGVQSHNPAEADAPGEPKD